MKHMIGISLGSQNTVVGVLKQGNVDIILSETSSRCVPTLSSFSDRQRYYGDAAFSTIKTNFARTISYPNRYLGLQADWPFVKEENKYAVAQPSVDSNNKIGFELTYKGEKEFVYPEAAVGLFFNKLKNNWINAGYDTKEVVITVPDYYTAHERKALIEAIQIADLNCLSLLNESSALTLAYGLFRRNQFEDTKPRYVAFVDMGQSSTSITFSSFTKNLSKVISVTTERFCGAREFDYVLMEHFSAIFNKKYGCNPMLSAKTRLRMVDIIAKARKILTGNREAAVNVDSLMEDEDLHAVLSREEFEQLIAPVLEKFRKILISSIEKAAEEAKISLADLHSVEMVGDAIRTPILQTIVKDIFGLELSKTLFPDECLARGATLFAAMTSPFFVLKDFTLEHYNPYSINLEYPFLKDGAVQIRNHKIISKTENLPNRKSIKFSEKQIPKNDLLTLKFSYLKEEIPFLSNILLSKF